MHKQTCITQLVTQPCKKEKKNTMKNLFITHTVKCHNNKLLKNWVPCHI